jgi:hypothetical protein
MQRVTIHHDVARHGGAHHRAARQAASRLALGLALAGLALLAMGCSGDGENDADDHDIPGVYIAVIRALAPDGAAVMPKSVYVEALPGTKLSLEDQAAVVKAFGEDTVVRFIDDRKEAVDDKSPQASVRRDGVLLQMNPAQTTEHGLSIKTTRYVARDDEHTACLELEQHTTEWAVSSVSAC